MDRLDRADQAGIGQRMDSLQIGAAADQLAVMAARLLEQDVERAADHAGEEGALAAFQQVLQFE